MKSLKLYCTLFIIHSTILSQSIIVNPYLQKTSTNSITIMWEIDQEYNGYVQWGESPQLGNTTNANIISSQYGNYLLSCQVNNLNENTKYYYRVVHDDINSETYSFYTNHNVDAESQTNIIAMSDMQKDGSEPNKFNEIVHSGIISYIESNISEDINENIDLILIPGDLVENGLNYQQWQNDFFGQSHPLFSYIPVYPVPGNHENNSEYFFKYFDLPLNGTPGYEEHWWFKDISNIRIIGLDSNSEYQVEEQLSWLENILIDTENNTNIDFVFAQLHHPHKSELWTPGNTDYTGQVINLLENFSSQSGKPSIHFFGHTHGYSRGQSRDHTHLMVNVASAGGRIDYWGEYPNNDYDEYSISQDEYGYVVVETVAGDNPMFTLKRFSIGDANTFKNNSLEDSITVRKINNSPNTPNGIFPNPIDIISPDCITLLASEFSDLDDDEHGASQWQISTNCNDFNAPIYDIWRQFENWYNEENTQINDNLTDQEITQLDAFSSYCWRVRYRDKSLAWSNWSNPINFNTGSSEISENLLENSGAEENINYWQIETGILESLSEFECNGTSPFSEEKYFCVGGVCEEYPLGLAYQIVDISDYSSNIDLGLYTLIFGAHLSNWNGNDTPSIGIECLDENNINIYETEMLSSVSQEWELKQSTLSIPVGTRKIKYKVMGERNSGTDNDSYIDETFLKIGILPQECNPNISINILNKYKINLHPNPFQYQSTLTVETEANTHLTLNIYDNTGKLHKTYKHVHLPLFTISKGNLKEGTYYLEILDDINRINVIQFEIIN